MKLGADAKARDAELAASLKAAGETGVAAAATAADAAIAEFVTAAGLSDTRPNADPAKAKTLSALIANGMNPDAYRNATDKPAELSKVVDAAVKAGGYSAAVSDSFSGNLAGALKTAGYPAKADPAAMNVPMIILLLTILVIYVTMVYGPIAAMLVELFPTRIRYTSMSLPYHIGNGWFGGFLPTTAFAIVAATGNIYSGLWYPIVVAVITLVVGTLFLKDTRHVDIRTN